MQLQGIIPVKSLYRMCRWDICLWVVTVTEFPLSVGFSDKKTAVSFSVFFNMHQIGNRPPKVNCCRTPQSAVDRCQQLTSVCRQWCQWEHVHLNAWGRSQKSSIARCWNNIDIIVHLLDVPRWTSASSLFVLHRVPTFAAVICKLTYSLYDCIRKSSNSPLIACMESDLYYCTKLLHKWRRLLYTCMD